VPLLHLSGVEAGPGPDGGAGGRVLVNLDLTNAQPAPGNSVALRLLLQLTRLLC
jgi:hypothetical protein